MFQNRFPKQTSATIRLVNTTAHHTSMTSRHCSSSHPKQSEMELPLISYGTATLLELISSCLSSKVDSFLVENQKRLCVRKHSTNSIIILLPLSWLSINKFREHALKSFTDNMFGLDCFQTSVKNLDVHWTVPLLRSHHCGVMKCLITREREEISQLHIN